jgi:hypothetical protein
MGLDFRVLADYAGAISKSQQTSATMAGDENLLVFDFVLWTD